MVEKFGIITTKRIGHIIGPTLHVSIVQKTLHTFRLQLTDLILEKNQFLDQASGDKPIKE